MERVLSALAYWASIFEKLEDLPAMQFPFVKVFEGDLFAAFEVVMTVLCEFYVVSPSVPNLTCLGSTVQ